MIIDFHTHTFPDKIAEKTVQKLAKVARIAPFTNGSAGGLTASMGKAGVSYCVNLPVMTTPEQTEKINSDFIRDREKLLAQGIIPFGGIHPDYADYKKEIRRLKENHIPGIKLHAAYQDTDMDDIRYLRIMDCASQEGLVIMVHAGWDMACLEKNYCTVAQILHVLDEVHPEKLVLAHMGNWGNWDEVERDLAGAPVWLDTSFSYSVAVPDPLPEHSPITNYRLQEETFLRLCKKHGTDRILFGTDSPWTGQKESIEQLKAMAFTEKEKKQILAENAVDLLGMPEIIYK